MRRIALMLAVLGFVGAAHAADVGAQPPYPAPVPAPYNWTGAYAGLNIGGGYASVSATDSFAGASGTGSETLTGFVGGGQLGFNWQAGPAVIGLEGDFQGSTQSNSITIGPYSATDEITYFGTLRGRLGLALDRWLPYVTGGWGYGGWSTKASLSGVGNFSATTSHDLWVFGGGLEVGIWGNWTAKAEYLFIDTGQFTTLLGPVTVKPTLQDNVFRIGLNYHF